MQINSILNKKILFSYLNFVVPFLLLIFFGVIVFVSEIVVLVSYMPDDAFYYQQIALNFREGLGLTFDGVNQTNGYQPLWMYILTGLYSVFDYPKEMMFRITLFVQLIISLFSLYFYYTTLKQIINYRLIRYSAFIIFFFFLYFKAITGMDTALLILLYSILFKVYINKEKYSESTFILISGLLTGLIILTRLDQAPLTILFPFLIIANLNELKNKYKNLIIYWGVTAILVLPYFIGNIIVWGNLMPVSVWVKSSFPSIILHHTTFSTLAQNSVLVLALIVLSGYPVWLIISRKLNYEPVNQKLRKFTLLIWTIVAIHFFYLILFLTYGLSPWHFSLYYFTLSLIIIEPVHYLVKYKKIIPLLLLFLIVLNLYSAYKFINRYENANYNSWQVNNYNIAVLVKNSLPQDSRFFYTDCGIFGFFSERTTINGDGLVNNYEYQEILKSGGLGQYLKVNSITHIVIFMSEEFLFESFTEKLILPVRFAAFKYHLLSDEVFIKLENLVYVSERGIEPKIYRTLVFKLD